MFFLNPFAEEFRGNWVLGDRAQSLTFICPPNTGRSQEEMVSFVKGPYDLTGNDTDGVDKSYLTVNFAIDPEFKNYTSIAIDIESGAASSSAVTPEEIVTALNADATFADRFEASTVGWTRNDDPEKRIRIRHKSTSMKMRSYISINGAETAIGFNRRGGVAELPTYFDRHTIANRFNFTDSQNHLIALNHVITGNTVANPTVVTSPGHNLSATQIIYITGSNSDPTINGTRIVSSPSGATFTVPVNVTTTAGDRGRYSTLVEYAIINAAVDVRGKSLGFDATVVKDDWDLLTGRSGLFNCQNITVDGSDRITQIIEYPTGAKAGDFARMIKYTYTSTNTKPDTINEVPYVLRSGDIVSVP